MITSEYQNTINRIKLVLLRNPMIVPRWGHMESICPPLGLAYVAASLQQAGYEVSCLDALGEAPFQRNVLEDKKFISFGLSTEQILQHLEFKDFNVLFVSLMFSCEWPINKSIIQTIKKKYPNVLLVCGGEHISACPEFCMKDSPEIDVCVLGEGEETSIDLLKTIEQKKSLSKVNGIVFRSTEGIVRNPNRARINKLEEISWPAWDLFPLENYLSNGLGYGVNPGRSMPMLISRGCPYQCTFCSSPQMWTTKWQARNVDLVIEEMQFYIDKYKAQNFDFYDLTTIVRKDWIVNFCQKIIKKNWNITWQMPSGTRSEALDDETLGLMMLSGQKHISYAPESASKTTLQKIKKKIKIENMKKSIRSALSKGISVKLNLMLGFPDETHKDIFITFWYLIKMSFIGVHDVSMGVFAPYPGSEIYDDLIRKGKIKHDDEYWGKLAYVDLSFAKSYCENISSKSLLFYNWLGYFLFYGFNYIFRPLRLYTTIKNLVTNKHESKGEMALAQFIKRISFVFKASRRRAN